MKNTMKKAMAAVMVMATMLLAMPGTDAQAAKVKMSKPSMTLKAGQSKTLKLKNAVGKVKWTSSKKSVASVTKKGKVTARKAGSALIWAQAKGHTYRCSVTVINAAKKDNANNAADTENTDVTNTDTDTDSANTGTSATDTQTTTEDTQPDKTETKPAHEHNWVPHYTYGGDGKPYADGTFCSDVTCPYNRGYGTDNGWRGESLTNSTGTGATEPSQGTSVQQPAAPVTDNTGNTQDTVTTKPSVTEPVVTENPVQDEQTKEHRHAWTIPVLSDDKLTVVGYACACGEKAEHDHEWTEPVYYTDGILAGVIKEWKCTCGETLTAEGYDKLYENNTKASKEIMENWIAQNITADMTDLQKVKAVINEIKTWEYSYTDAAYTSANITRKGVCESGNRMFVRYCEAMGIKAERVDMQQYGIEDHTAAYVWIDGEQHFADATPGAQGLMGSQDVIWTMDGLDLYLDCLNGIVTDEEFDEYMPGYEK